MRARFVLAAASVSALAGGCQKPVAWPGPPEVVLGGGVLRFLAWNDCARVPIIHGVQGGYHVWGGVRARYVTLARLKLRFSVTGMDGRLISYPGGIANPIQATADLDPLSPSMLSATDGGARGGGTCPDGGVPIDSSPSVTEIPSGTDGWGETYAITVFMPFDRGDGGEYLPTGDVDGRPVRIRLDITDSDGRTASDERVVVPFYRQ